MKDLSVEKWAALASILAVAVGALAWTMGKVRAWRWCRAEKRADELIADARATADRAGATLLAESVVPLLTARDERAAKVIEQRGLGEVRGQTLAIRIDRRPGGALGEVVAQYISQNR